ncbi:MAG: MFS transporter [Oscillospiraceae bacterium]|jgi:DHA3 family macrolide efflux protein-like MFS transporter|nr:MFS transporter [Oscillospiraceae bacterium]
MKTNYSMRNVVLFLAGQIVSLFGSSLVQCAISWHITLETQSGTMMTIALVCGFLPTFLVSPFAGIWADRFNRKRLIILADALVATATLGLAAAFWLGLRDVRLIFAVMAVRGLGQGIQQPAVSSLLPGIVPQDKLLRVNSINSSAQAAMLLASPALAAVLISFASLENIFIIDIATAAVAIVILGFFVKVKQKSAEPQPGKASYLQDLKLGLGYIAKHKLIKQLFVFSAVMSILISPIAVLYALQVTRLFGADAWRLGFADAGFAAGMLLGGLLLTIWGGFKNKHSTMSLGMLVMSAGTVLCGVVSNFALYIAIMVFIGVSLPIFNTPAITLLQEKVDPDFLGRVFSLTTMLSSLAMPLGLIVFGPLADIIGLNTLFIITGAAQLAVTLFAVLNKTIRAAGVTERAAPEEPSE